jgi:Xaa-Pro aminopeptidase
VPVNISAAMLDIAEKVWLNEYHRRVYETLAPFLAEEERIWLGKETRRI